MEEDELYAQLRKLSALTSEESLEEIITTLWRTRKMGLRSLEKSSFQSLLRLSSVKELDPVLACLRSLIRKYTRKNMTREDLLKLLPPDLALVLQERLVRVLQKHTGSWKLELSKEQHLLLRTRPSSQAIASVPQPSLSLPSSQTSASVLACQDNHIEYLSPDNVDCSASVNANDHGVLHPSSTLLQSDICPPDNLGKVQTFKSIKWNIENPRSMPAHRVAVVSLALEDCREQPPRETEVKFKVTRDILETVLRSITHISEKLSCSGMTSTEPAQKKHKQ